MALLVFLTFLSLITNQYVPVWMKDSEAAHMGEVLGQLGDFKSDIDTQILGARVSAQLGQRYLPYTSFSTIKLGVDGVPIFSSPTIGELQINQQAAPWTVWFRYSAGGNNTTVPEGTSCSLSDADQVCGGHVRLRVFNRYFPQQTIAYENGALIRSQFDGEVIKGEPTFAVFRSNTSVQVDFTLVRLFGSGGVAGIGSEGLAARVSAADLQEYTDINTAVWVNHTSLFGPAWYRFLNATLAAAYDVTTDLYQSNPDFTYEEIYGPGGQPIQLRADNPIYLVESVWDSGASVYDVTVEFKLDEAGDSVAVLPVGAFRLLHAFADIQAGERGTQVGG